MYARVCVCVCGVKEGSNSDKKKGEKLKKRKWFSKLSFGKKVLPAAELGGHTALSNQARPSAYILRGAYYLKDRGTRPKV